MWCNIWTPTISGSLSAPMWLHRIRRMHPASLLSRILPRLLPKLSSPNPPGPLPPWGGTQYVRTCPICDNGWRGPQYARIRLIWDQGRGQAWEEGITAGEECRRLGGGYAHRMRLVTVESGY